ncbi:protein BatD [bacterium SCSIO 12696]|nr:protein BatD [bacterium SCSIO 12696]
MTLFSRFLFVFLLLATTQASAATLTSSVNRSTLAANESLELTLVYKGGNTNQSIEFSTLDSQFERVSAPRHQQSFQWINGESESSQVWQITLHPKSTGTLTIPAFELAGVRSQPIAVTVKAAATKPDQQNPVFLEAEADKESLYVQEQLLVTYRLYHEVPLANITPGWGDIDNAEILQLGQEEYQATLGGRQYEVIEWRFALFPNASGTLEVPPFRINAYSPSGIRFRSGRRFNQFSKSLELPVKPKPANGGSHWLPASNVELTEQAIDANREWRVGEPLTRKITLTGMGTTSTFLPPVSIPDDTKLRSYPDQPKLEQAAAGNGVIASRTESIALVPTEPGIITLPAVEVQWWDTNSNRLKTARLAEKTLQVLPAETPNYTPPTTVQTNTVEVATEETPHWGIWISVAINLLMAIAIVLLLVFYRRNHIEPTSEPQTSATSSAGNEKELFANVRRHSKAGDTLATRNSIIAWANAYWPQQASMTLDKLGRLVNDSELHQKLNALDQQLYGPTATEVDLPWIATQLKRFRAHGGGAHKPSNGDNLMPLYPQ